MALVDEALSTLRQQASAATLIAAAIRSSCASTELNKEAEKLEAISREIVDNVEILQITSYAVSPPTAAQENSTNANARDATPRRAVSAGIDASPNELWKELLRKHDDDYAAARDGLPPHVAGELPESCPSCALFAELADGAQDGRA